MLMNKVKYKQRYVSVIKKTADYKNRYVHPGSIKV